MRNPDDWRRIATEAQTRANDLTEHAVAREDERDDDGAAHLNRIAHYWYTIADNIYCALGAEAAYPPEPYPSAEVSIPSPSDTQRKR